MILARCPACSTTFRVRPEQLSARHGRVRCGHCQHAFNALDNQVKDEALTDDLPPPEPVVQAAADSTTSPLFVLQEKLPDTADAPTPESAAPAAEAGLLQDAFSQDDTPALAPDIIAVDDETPAVDAPPPPPPEAAAGAGTDSAILEAPAFLTFEDEETPPSGTAPRIPEIVDDRIEPVGEIHLAALDEGAEDGPPPATEAAPPDELLINDAFDEDEDAADSDTETPVTPFPFKPDWPDASELDLKSPPDPSLVEDGPLDFDSLLHKQVVDDTPGTPQQALDRDIPAERPPAGMPIESPPAATLADEAQAEQDGSFTEEMEEPSGPSPLQQAAWAAGATLLVLALLAQGVLVFRSEIAQSSPQMRLFMESVCAGMDCELPLPHESASITIESSDIQPDASREAFFTLHATLRNRAEFAQAWPHLEITLTDARDKALVRRVLEPKQWLPADMPQDAFPARKEVAARVRFEAPGIAAAGYRVYAFYP